MKRLWRDQRGGVDYVLYLVLVAGIAIVALPAVRGFTSSAKNSFRTSTTRFDRPGTYTGGSIRTVSRSRWQPDLPGPPPVETSTVWLRTGGSGGIATPT